MGRAKLKIGLGYCFIQKALTSIRFKAIDGHFNRKKSEAKIRAESGKMTSEILLPKRLNLQVFQQLNIKIILIEHTKKYSINSFLI